jgi:hypothetical protein
MDIGIIGHLGAAEAAFRNLASAVGHDAAFYDRVIDGARPEQLGPFIDGCSMVVIVVDATPVALVRAASEHLTRRRRTPLLLRRCELGRFVSVMAVVAGHGGGDPDEEESRPRLRTGSGAR